MKIKYIILTTIIISFLTIIIISLSKTSVAANIQLPCYSLPGLPPCGNIEENDIAGYLRNLYITAISIVGIIAVGAIVIGAIIIVFSQGKPDKQNEGKDIITSAVWGVVLLLSASLILKTVNPRIAALEKPNIEKVESCQYDANGNPIKTPCVPKELGYEDIYIPGDDPVAPVSNTTIAQAVNAAWQYCEAIHPPIPPGKKYKNKNISIFENCVVQMDKVIKTYGRLQLNYLDPAIPVKPGICRWYQETSVCQAHPNTIQALQRLLNSYPPRSYPPRTGNNLNWRITEAFPPTIYHSSLQHYNGCAVDIGFYVDGCGEKQKFVDEAIRAGFKVFNEFMKSCPNLKCPSTSGTTCNGANVGHATMQHFHLTTVNCP